MLHSASLLFSPLVEKNFRRLWVAQLLSEAGDWAARLALASLVYVSTQSALLSALTVAVSLLPALGPGQILTSYLDRFDRRKVLVGLDVARAVLFASLAFSPPVWMVLLVALLAGLLTAPFDAIQSSMSVEVPSPKRRDGALTLIQITQDASALIGYAVGGALLVFLSPGPALLVNAASFLLSAVLLSRLPLPVEDIVESSPWRGIHDAVSVLKSHRGFLLMAVLSISTLTVGTVVESLVVAFYQEADRPNLAGVALPLIGIATIVLILIASPHSKKQSIPKTSLYVFVLGTLAALGLWLLPPTLSIIAFALAGVLFLPVAVSAVLVKPLYPRAKRATTVSFITGVRSGLSALVIVIVGALADTVGTHTALAVLVFVSALIALVVAIKARGDLFATPPPQIKEPTPPLLDK